MPPVELTSDDGSLIVTSLWRLKNAQKIQDCQQDPTAMRINELVGFRLLADDDNTTQCLHVLDSIATQPGESAVDIIQTFDWLNTTKMTSPYLQTQNNQIIIKAMSSKQKVTLFVGERGLGKTLFIFYLRDVLHAKEPCVGILITPPGPESDDIPGATQFICEAVEKCLEPIMAVSHDKKFGGKVSMMLFLDDAEKFGALVEGVIDEQEAIRSRLNNKYELQVHIVLAGLRITFNKVRHREAECDYFFVPPVPVSHREALYPDLENYRTLWELSKNLRHFCALKNIFTGIDQKTTLDEVKILRELVQGVQNTPLQTCDLAWRVLFKLDINELEKRAVCDAGMGDTASDESIAIFPQIVLALLDRFAIHPVSYDPSGFEGFWSAIIIGAIRAVQSLPNPSQRTLIRVLQILNVRSTAVTSAGDHDFHSSLDAKEALAPLVATVWLQKKLPRVDVVGRKLHREFFPEISGDDGVKFTLAAQDCDLVDNAERINVLMNYGNAQYADIMVWVYWNDNTSLKLNVQVKRYQDPIPRRMWNESLWVMGSGEPGLPSALLKNEFLLFEKRFSQCIRTILKRDIRISSDLKRNMLDQIKAAEWKEITKSTKPASETNITEHDVDLIVFSNNPCARRVVEQNASLVDRVRIPTPGSCLQIIAGLGKLCPVKTSDRVHGLTMSVTSLAPQLRQGFEALYPSDKGERQIILP